MANKKNTKKKEDKKETKKEEFVGTELRKLLSDFKIAVLYFICALCWLVSGILEYVASKKIPYLDIVITIVLIALGIVYYKKSKKNKK